MFKTSELIEKISEALSKAQGEIKQPGKNRVAKVQMKSGGSYSYSYADLSDVLEAVRKPFAANGLSIVQTPYSTPNGIGLVTRLLHSSGQWIEGSMEMMSVDSRPQSAASIITYLRRYMISPMTGVSADSDDDGCAAAGIEAHTCHKGVYSCSDSDKKKLIEECARAQILDVEQQKIINGLMEGKTWDCLPQLIAAARKENGLS